MTRWNTCASALSIERESDLCSAGERNTRLPPGNTLDLPKHIRQLPDAITLLFSVRLGRRRKTHVFRYEEATRAESPEQKAPSRSKGLSMGRLCISGFLFGLGTAPTFSICA